MATYPRWLDATDTEITAAQAIAQVVGAPGSAVVLKLVNNPGGAQPSIDPMVNGRIVAEFRNAGDTLWQTAGTEWADRRYLEARITGPYLATEGVVATGFQPIGANASLDVPVDLGDDEGIEYEFRLNAPADALDDAEEIALRVESATSEPAEPALSAAVGDGISLPLRDAGAHLLVSGGDAVENPGGADDEVEVQTAVWIGAGQLWSTHRQLVQILASTSSTERLVYVVRQPDGTLTTLDGPEEAPPAVTPPMLSEGDLLEAVVTRDDTATIVDADIANRWTESLGLYSFRSSGLTAFVSPGRPGRGRRHALVDAAALTNRVEQPIPLSANETNFLWLLRDGSIGLTLDEDPPSDRALLIHEADTDGSDVIAHRDRRELVGGHRLVLPFSWSGPLTAGAKRYAVLPGPRDAYLSALIPIAAVIGTQGGVGGATRFDVEVEPPGGAFASILHASLDRPTIAFDATDLRDLASVPATWRIPGGSRIRATVQTVPTTPSEDASLVLTIWS